MRIQKNHSFQIVYAAPLCNASPGNAAFSYSERLFERMKTLWANVIGIDRKSSNIERNGGESTQP